MCISRDRRGFTLLEVMVVSGLMSLLALLISAAWAGVGRPAADAIIRGQLVQEIDMALASLARDLGGALANPEARLGGKKQGQWIGWKQLAESEAPEPQLWLCYDGGVDPNGQPDWATPDTIIIYKLQNNALIRWDLSAGKTFTVARHVQGFDVTPVGSDGLQIVLTFTYRNLTRTCTLTARLP